MIDSYKNVLANKFMRDTNYIIIKDTDDLEELEREWELFNTCLTVRQQRLSDDRSVEIWNMTNMQHYEALKQALIGDLAKEYDDQFYDNDEYVEFDRDDTFDYEEEPSEEDEYIIPDEEEEKEEIEDSDEYLKEESEIEDNTVGCNCTKCECEPNSAKTMDEIRKKNDDPTLILRDGQKDLIADQWQIDNNICIIGSQKGNTLEEYLQNLEQDFINWNSQRQDLRKKSDDECRQVYGMSNQDRYNFLKAKILKLIHPDQESSAAESDAWTTSDAVEEMGGFVLDCYRENEIMLEQEYQKSKQHKRLNDLPYFTPSELIDLGVHGNDNYYSDAPDNDGLIQGTKIPLWFDSYKDMCMDHIFEDYRKEWIDTLDKLYSDFEEIKESGDEARILARKQSILDLGWNPEIPFNRENRLKASERVNGIIEQTIPKDVFIDLTNIEIDDSEEYVEEAVESKTHKPVFLIFTQGKTPVVSQGIKFFTGSEYSHASISFDPSLNEVYSYNLRGENFGFIKENRKSFKDNFISVMCFFAPNNTVKEIKKACDDFKKNAKATTFDLGIFFNKIIHLDRRPSKDQYKQVCSTFVDTVLKRGNIELTDSNIPDPGQLYIGAKSLPNKIVEVYEGIATKYNGSKVKRLLNQLLKSGIEGIEEACKDVATAREFVRRVGDLAKEYDANYFIVTDGASGIHNNGNPAVKNARDAQVKWEKTNGYDPDEDWSHPVNEGWYSGHRPGITVSEVNLVPATKVWGSYSKEDIIDYIYKCDMESIEPSYRNNPRYINYMKKDAKESVGRTQMITYDNDLIIGMVTLDTRKDSEGYVYLGELYIEEKYRGLHIGSAIIEDITRAYPKVILRVAKSNTRARKLYEKYGFKIIKEDEMDGSCYIMTYNRDSVNEAVILESLDPKYRVIEYPSKEADELLGDGFDDPQYKISKGVIIADGNTVAARGFVVVSGEDKGYMHAVRTNEKYKRQGLGSYVVNYLKNNYGASILQVLQTNKPAIEMYKKCGFTKISKPYKDGDGFSLTMMTPEEYNRTKSILPEGFMNEASSSNGLYFISEKNLNGKTLSPRVPENFLTKNGYEDDSTERVCFSKSVDGCLTAMSANIENKTFFVYTPADSSIDYYQPNTDEVPDSEITQEVWVTEPVELRCIGKIKVEDAIEKPLPYTYGDGKTAELYNWNWDWIEKTSVNEAISDLDSAEGNDIYHNIDLWESGESNLLFVTGISGSGKSTLSREVSGSSKDTIHIELDNLMRAKTTNWNGDLDEVTESYIRSVGGIDNIFTYTNDKEKITFNDVTMAPTEMDVPNEFNKFFDFIFKYANSHKNKRFVVEGVQIALGASNSTITKMDKYPVIIKMNGPLKTEFRREKRAIGKYKDDGADFITIMKKLKRNTGRWINGGLYLDDWKGLKSFKKAIGESTQISILNEVKRFPVEFDKEGNLIIYKCRVGNIAYGDEINDSVELLKAYRNASNIEGMKYELAKLWFLTDSMEKKLKKRLTNDQYKELLDDRSFAINVFKTNLEYVMQAEKGFNFQDYYNSTPFSDNSVKITANTLKYSMQALKTLLR